MSTVMLNVIMWSGVMPYFFMLRVVMLNVILPSVVAPGWLGLFAGLMSDFDAM